MVFILFNINSKNIINNNIIINTITIIIIITCCKEIVVWSLSCDSTEVKRNINTFQDLVQLWMAGLIGRGTAKLLL